MNRPEFNVKNGMVAGIGPMKTLTEMLEDMEPVDCKIESSFISKKVLADYVDRASYDRMKRVAIELAKAIVEIESYSNSADNGCYFSGKYHEEIARKSLSSAKDIIGEGR